MDKQIITFSANEQTLRKTGGLDIFATKTVSYIEAHFDLGQNWSGYDSVEAVWWNDYVRPVRTVLDTEGVCVVPTEVLLRKSVVFVNLVGVIASGNTLTDRLTTVPITALTVKFNAQLGEGTTTPLTPSEYEQFVATVKADADRAEEAKDEARGFASSAEISAQNASISETNASTSEDNAKASELNAETYKNQAQTYAQNANNSAISAENAKDEAEDARDTILGMRAEATTLPEGSSATASYNDGVMSFGIPKGDTGARGATGETGATPQLSIGTVETTTEPIVTITGTAENPVLNFGLVKGDKGDTGEVSLADLSTLLPTDTASGAIASFPDGQSVIPALSVLCDIEPIQDLHGYDKPWSGGAGANKFDEITELGAIGSNGVPYATNDSIRSKNYCACIGGTTYHIKGVVMVAWYDANKAFISADYANNNTKTAPSNAEYFRLGFYASYGTTYNHDIAVNYPSSVTTYSPYSNICPISGWDEAEVSRVGINVWDEEWVTYSTTGIRSKNPIPVFEGKAYYVKVPNNGYVSVDAVNASGAYQSFIGNKGNETFVIPNGCKFIRFTHITYGTTYNHDISINYPSTDTDYHAYKGNTFTIDLGRTVYGGTLDLVSGELTVTYAIEDMGDLNWTSTLLNGAISFYVLLSGAKLPSSNGVKANILSSAYETDTANNIYTDATSGRFSLNTSGYIQVRNSNYSDASTFKTAMSGQTICYELATPQTYQLDPQTIDLLLGDNNVWTDCGSVEVTYKADVGLYIDKKLSSNGTRSLSMGLTKSATAEAETEAEPSKTEAETKTEETKTEASKTETETEAVEAKTETDKSETR